MYFPYLLFSFLQVEWLEQQHIKKRVKRDFLENSKRATLNRVEALQQGLRSRDSKKLENVIKNPKKLTDPEYRSQWYMVSMMMG